MALALSLALQFNALGQASSRLSQRGPLVTDDSAHGYAINDNWFDRRSQKLYLASSVSVGAAVWGAVAAPSLCLDAVTSAAAAYGTVKLRAAYAGNAFQVRRTSDLATVDINFLSSGIADFATADAFLAGAAGTTSKWYDQSGNALDMTSDAAGHEPPYWYNLVGTVRSLGFTSTKYLVLPAGLSLDRQNSTGISVSHPMGSYLCTFWTLGSTQMLTGIFNNGAQEFFNGVNDQAGKFWETGPAVRIGAPNATNSIISTDDQISIAATAATAATMTGGYVPRSTGTMDGNISAIIFYPSRLSTSDLVKVRQSLYYQFGIAPQVRDTLVMAGDSITHGNNANQTDGRSFPQVAWGQFTRDYLMANLGVPGQLLSAEASTDYTPLIKTGAKNVVHVFAGTNDIAANGTGATVATNIAALCTALKSGGFTKVIVATVLPRTGGLTGGQTTGGFETERLAANVTIRANWATYADAICDYGAHPIMGLAANVADTTLYSDTIHPTSLGHGLLAPYLLAAVNSFG